MAKKEEKQGFIEWWNSSETVKIWVGRVYSIGAAVVIIGALFKIMHFPGAGLMLMLGMGTEAVLFTLGYFDKPHVNYHWEKVFAQFSDENIGTLNLGSGIATAAPASVSASSVKNVADSAEAISSLSSMSGAMESLKKTLENAASETEKFVKSQSQLSTSSEKLAVSYGSIAGDMDNVVAQTQNYSNQVSSVAANLTEINSIYAMQLQSVKTQAKAYETINEMIETSVQDAQAFKNGAEKLSQQVSSLNGIYGNMLNALS